MLFHPLYPSVVDWLEANVIVSLRLIIKNVKKARFRQTKLLEKSSIHHQSLIKNLVKKINNN